MKIFCQSKGNLNYISNMKGNETQDGLTSHFGLTKVHKVGKTNKANKIVRIEHYKELSFQAVLTQIKKTERTEQRRSERQKYRRSK